MLDNSGQHFFYSALNTIMINSNVVCEKFVMLFSESIPPCYCHMLLGVVLPSSVLTSFSLLLIKIAPFLVCTHMVTLQHSNEI